MPQGAHSVGDQRAGRPRADFHVLGVLSAAVFGTLLGCDVGALAPTPPPPVHLVDVLVAKDLTGGIPTRYEALQADGTSADVVATTSFVLEFDRFLLPSATFRQSVCLEPVLGLVKAAKDCAKGILLEPAYDPVHKQLTYRQAETSAGLVSGIRYTLSIFPPPGDGTPSGIEAFDGAPLEAAVSREFTTRPSEPAGTHVLLPPSAPLCSIVTNGILRSSCATRACHNGNDALDHGVAIGPPEGLDLSSLDAIRATAIGHAAHGTQTGEHADEAEVTPSRFGRAMPLIDPTRPGNSYLLYKALLNVANTSPLPDAAREKQRLAETERLREAILVGMPMPPTKGDDKSKQLNDAQLEQISAWILQGAPTDPCP